jgi:hypothetical protein
LAQEQQRLVGDWAQVIFVAEHVNRIQPSRTTADLAWEAVAQHAACACRLLQEAYQPVLDAPDR